MSFHSSWLSFFAELSAKLTHHNILVVKEGCLLFMRLLRTDVSAILFVHEGKTISQILDMLSGTIISRSGTKLTIETGYINGVHAVEEWSESMMNDVEFIFLLLDALDLFGEMMMSFIPSWNDGREGTTIKNLETADSVHACSLHVATTLITAFKRLNPCSCFARAVDGRIGFTLRKYVIWERTSLKCLRMLEGFANEDISYILNKNAACKNVHMTTLRHCLLTPIMNDRLSPALESLKTLWLSIPLGEEDSASPSSVPSYDINDIETIVQKLEAATKHILFLEYLSELWLWVIVQMSSKKFIAPFVGASVQDEVRKQSGGSLFTGALFSRSFRKFFIQAPAEDHPLDLLVFLSILRLSEELIREGSQIFNDETLKDELIGVCPFLVVVLSTCYSSGKEAVDHSLLRNRRPNCLSASLGLQQCIIQFLKTAEECLTSYQIESWIQRGMLHTLLVILEPFGEGSSLLTDVPTLHDGSLSQEVYLACALEQARCDNHVIAVMSIKLISSLLINHLSMLKEVFSKELAAFQTSVIPLLARIAVSYPTVYSRQSTISSNVSDDSAIRYHQEIAQSLCYRLPENSRSSRYTPLGECAAIGLDGAVRSTIGGVESLSEDWAIPVDIIPFLPNIARVTSKSIFPHIRGLLFRILTHSVNCVQNLLTLVTSMPSAVSGPVVIVLNYNPMFLSSAHEWEVAAAAEWISQVIRQTVADSSIGEKFNFLQTALPLKLLHLASQTKSLYVAQSFLTLLMGLSDQERQIGVTVMTDGQEGRDLIQQQSGRFRSFISPLAPSGSSVHHWKQLIQTACSTLRGLETEWLDIMTIKDETSCTKDIENSFSARRTTTALHPVYNGTVDTPHRLVSESERCAVKMLFVCSLLECLSAVYSSPHIVADLCPQLFPQEMMDLLEAVFICPTPDQLSRSMAARLGTDIVFSRVLQRSYDSLIQSASKFYSQEYYPYIGLGGTGTDLLPIQSHLLSKISCRIRDSTLSVTSRQSIAIVISVILETAVPLYHKLSQSIGEYSEELFISLLTLGSHRCHSTLACQSRLVSLFQSANKVAFKSLWVRSAVCRLRAALGEGRKKVACLPLPNSSLTSPTSLKLIVPAKLNKQSNVKRVVCSIQNKSPSPTKASPGLVPNSSPNSDPMTSLTAVALEEVQECLTIISSAYSFPHSIIGDQEEEGTAQFPLILFKLLNSRFTRRMALKVCRAISASELGRMVLVSEVQPCPGDSSNRSIFAKIVQMTVGSEMNGSLSITGAAIEASNGAVCSGVRKRFQHHLTDEFYIGIDTISCVVQKGGDSFAQVIVKLRALENTTTYLTGLRHQRITIPATFFRFLAAVSFSTEVQPLIARQSELLTILIETAQIGDDRGSLSLLALRNISFFPTTKIQLSHDSRLLMLYKCAILRQAPEGSDTPVDALTLFRRQELAMGALASLVYNNQRTKSYIRGLLNQPPIINLNELADEVSPSNTKLSSNKSSKKSQLEAIMTQSHTNARLLIAMGV